MELSKVAYCKVCQKAIIVIASFPDCESDKQTQKEFQKLAQKGHRINILPSQEAKELFGCECNKQQQKLF